MSGRKQLVIRSLLTDIRGKGVFQITLGVQVCAAFCQVSGATNPLLSLVLHALNVDIR